MMQLTETIAAEQQRKLGRDREAEAASSSAASSAATLSAAATSSLSGGGGVDGGGVDGGGVDGGGVDGGGVDGGGVDGGGVDTIADPGSESWSAAMVVVEDGVDVRKPMSTATASTDETNAAAVPQPQPKSQSPPSQSANKLSFSEELQCPVCFDLLATPALFPECGHVFCCRCAFMSVQTSREGSISHTQSDKRR